MKVAIIEDEHDARQLLTDILNQYCTKINIVTTAWRREDVAEIIKSDSIDLIFLDIQLGGYTAFDVLSEVDEISPKIVFTTAYDQYALHAFDFNAIHYLLKPYAPQDVIAAVDRAKESQVPSNFMTTIAHLDRYVNPSKMAQSRIGLTTTTGIIMVAMNDIIRVEADRSYCTLYLQCGETVTVSKPLVEIESKLPEHQFIRPHTSHLININKVTELLKADGGELIMLNGDRVPISRRKKKEIAEYLSS